MARVVYALLLILVLGYIAWPYASLYGLFVDLKTADVEGISERVNWPAVRTGFVGDFEQFSKKAANETLNANEAPTNCMRISLT